MRTLFDQVCHAYFPRWAGGVGWTVLCGPPPGYPQSWGLCDRKARRIWIHPNIVEGETAGAVACLVHEIVHAVVGYGHGPRFCKRMERAASRAVARGDHEVARCIEKDLDGLPDAEEVSSQTIYSAIADAVVDLEAETSFDRILAVVAGRYGMTVDEMTRRFGRVRQVFERAVRISGHAGKSVTGTRPTAGQEGEDP